QHYGEPFDVALVRDDARHLRATGHEPLDFGHVPSLVCREGEAEPLLWGELLVKGGVHVLLSFFARGPFTCVSFRCLNADSMASMRARRVSSSIARKVTRPSSASARAFSIGSRSG